MANKSNFDYKAVTVTGLLAGIILAVIGIMKPMMLQYVFPDLLANPLSWLTSLLLGMVLLTVIAFETVSPLIGRGVMSITGFDGQWAMYRNPWMRLLANFFIGNLILVGLIAVFTNNLGLIMKLLLPVIIGLTVVDTIIVGVIWMLVFQKSIPS